MRSCESRQLTKRLATGQGTGRVKGSQQRTEGPEASLLNKAAIVKQGSQLKLHAPRDMEVVVGGGLSCEARDRKGLDRTGWWRVANNGSMMLMTEFVVRRRSLKIGTGCSAPRLN